MNPNAKLLSVRLNGEPVGTLEQIKDGKMRFEYASNARQISFQFPLSKTRYGNMPCELYFGGLLPESEEARRAIASKFNINPNSTFALLRAIGRDCAGAISLHEPEDPIVADTFHPIEIRPLPDKELAKHIRDLPRKPLFIGLEGLRLSLAGVQEKAALCVIGGQIGLPLQETPTTHILKPAILRFPGSVQNEYLCLRTAANLKLPVPRVEVRKSDGEIYLLVERYDRKVDDQGRILRIHQEDFCQALGFREKYQRRGGPGFTDCFALLMNTAIPVIDRRLLMEAVILNYLIGNADAHGKNFSVLYDGEHGTRLAPFYDILCTQVYEDLSEDMCMKIGEHYNFSDVVASDWEKLCKTAAFSLPETKRLISKHTNDVFRAVKEERALLRKTEFDHEILDQVVMRVEKNCSRLEKLF
ncbi:MAG TPA: type II toxin-antitoxin system HipA family toxin [Candidatus Obscuribacterales bacterium]